MEAVRAAWRGLFTFLVVGTAVAGALAVSALFFDGSVLLASIGSAVFVFFLLAGIGAVWDTSRNVRIILFFAAPVGETDTFLYGQELARRFQALEALAAAAGVSPLSHFGFPDPLRGEAVHWHPAAEGLQSVRGLLGALGPDLEAARPDLVRLEAALSRAAEQGIEFSLLLLHGTTTSGLEWERRGGSAF